MDKTTKQQFIFAGILLLSNKFQTAGDKILSEITLKQWFVLIMIKNMNTDYVSVIEVANTMGYTRQNIKKLLVQLEKKGFVTIEPSKQDARSLAISLTDKSYNYFEENQEEPYRYLEQLFAGTEETELEFLASLLRKLLVNVELEVGED